MYIWTALYTPSMKLPRSLNFLMTLLENWVVPFATGIRDSPPLDGMGGVIGGGGGGRRGDGDVKYCGDNNSIDIVPPVLDTLPDGLTAD